MFQVREGVVVCLERIPLHLELRVREGVVVWLGNIGGDGVVRKHPPPVSCLKRGRVVVWLGNIPLRLAFEVRGGVVLWLGNIPLRLTF
jgi:hypothetical protein